MTIRQAEEVIKALKRIAAAPDEAIKALQRIAVSLERLEALEEAKPKTPRRNAITGQR